MTEKSSADDKEEFLSKQLLNHLTLIRSNFSFGLQFWALLKDPKTAEGLQVHRVVVKADGIYAVPPGKSMHIPEGESFYTLELRGPKNKDFGHASMTFEKLKTHCDAIGQDSAFKACNWYQFARIVRNALTHDQKWRFNKYDKSVLPVSWNGKTIDLTMDNTEITWEFFDPYDAMELWDEMYEFAKSVS